MAWVGCAVNCVTKLTLVECKLWVGVGTSKNIPIGYPCARTILAWRLCHTVHLGLMGEDGSYSGENGVMMTSRPSDVTWARSLRVRLQGWG